MGDLGWEEPLEKGMATHSSILAWRIPWTEEPGGLQSLGLQRVGHDGMTVTAEAPSGYKAVWLACLSVPGGSLCLPHLPLVCCLDPRLILSSGLLSLAFLVPTYAPHYSLPSDVLSVNLSFLKF